MYPLKCVNNGRHENWKKERKKNNRIREDLDVYERTALALNLENWLGQLLQNRDYS